MRIPSITALAWLAAGLLASTAGALAHDYKAGALTIDHPWSRATPGGAKVAAGYLRVTNTGSAPDRLIGGSLAVADRADVHTMSTEGGVMRMAPVEGGLVIEPGKTVVLEPSGYHMMFQGLRAPLTKGERVRGTLTFEKAGTVEVEFAVEAIAARSSGSGGQEQGHDHGHQH